jgi:hypothetical protein
MLNSLLGPFLAILFFLAFFKVSNLQTLEVHSLANFDLTGFPLRAFFILKIQKKNENAN